MPKQAELFITEKHETDFQSLATNVTARVPLYIGCAGWSLASPVQEHFPSEGSHLERYSRVLSAVEINSSFYRPHMAETYKRWRDSVPESFRFSVKMPRSITHQLRLLNTRAELLKFLEAAHHLEHKLGCILVQLPPSLKFVPSVAEDFFRHLRSLVTSDIVCEPRHMSWAAPEANEIFGELSITQVAADPPVIPVFGSPANTAYVRLHGSPIIYHSSYSNDYLRRMAKDFADHINLGRQVWCILDNTASGAAIPNALFLLDCCSTEMTQHSKVES